ncbi:MAG: cation-translocating P-type ATPase, partial [Planctomycetota bacterium]
CCSSCSSHKERSNPSKDIEKKKDWKKKKLFIWGLGLISAVAILFEILEIFDFLPHPWLPILLFMVTFFSFGWFLFWRGVQSLFAFRFHDIRLLMSLAVGGAVYLGSWTEGALILSLYFLGEEIEDFGVQKSESALAKLVEAMPEDAEVKGIDKPVPLEEIKIGDILVIRPGTTIPLDGKVVEGSSWVDESAITGEPFPKAKEPGSLVYGGTSNQNGYLEVEVTKTSKEGTLGKIQEIVFEAAETKSPSQRTIERFAQYYTPAVVLLALGIVFLPPYLNKGSFTFWLYQGVTLLLISCPCALVLSTPLAVFAAIGFATKKGVLIKGGKYIEFLSQVKAICFDKTRTLTTGELEVTDIIELGEHSKEEILACAGGMESFSEHPLAKSVVHEAQKAKVEIHSFENFEAVPGKGVKGECLVCDQKGHRLGTLPFAAGDMSLPLEWKSKIEELAKEGKTTLVMSEGDQLKGIIALQDRIRPEAPEVMEELKRMGLQVFILSGDHPEVTERFGKKIGANQAFGGLLPQDKEEKVRTLEQRFRVAMVGDGINDAPAMKRATVAIAMGAVGSDLAIENSDIALMNENLHLVPLLYRLSKKTLRTIRINLGLAIGVKLLFLILALLGMSHIGLAILSDVGITLVVVLNSLSLLTWKG